MLYDEAGWDEQMWQLVSEGMSPIEFDWFAIDPRGCLGVFASFGTGVMPRQVFASREGFNQLLQSINRLPATAEVKVHSQCTYQYVDSWVEYAQRGLYAFDTANAHGNEKAYHLIAYPQKAIIATDVLSQSVVSALPVLDQPFSEAARIDFSDIPG